MGLNTPGSVIFWCTPPSGFSSMIWSLPAGPRGMSEAAHHVEEHHHHHACWIARTSCPQSSLEPRHPFGQGAATLSRPPSAKRRPKLKAIMRPVSASNLGCAQNAWFSLSAPPATQCHPVTSETAQDSTTACWCHTVTLHPCVTASCARVPSPRTQSLLAARLQGVGIQHVRPMRLPQRPQLAVPLRKRGVGDRLVPVLQAGSADTSSTMQLMVSSHQC